MARKNHLDYPKGNGTLRKKQLDKGHHFYLYLITQIVICSDALSAPPVLLSYLSRDNIHIQTIEREAIFIPVDIWITE